MPKILLIVGMMVMGGCSPAIADDVKISNLPATNEPKSLIWRIIHKFPLLEEIDIKRQGDIVKIGTETFKKFDSETSISATEFSTIQWSSHSVCIRIGYILWSNGLETVTWREER